MEYLIMMMIIFAATLLYQRYAKIRLFPSTKSAALFYVMNFCVGFVWDTYALLRGLWVFPPHQTVGINLGVMPLEDALFALIVPYMVIVIYAALTKRRKK